MFVNVIRVNLNLVSLVVGNLLLELPLQFIPWCPSPSVGTTALLPDSKTDRRWLLRGVYFTIWCFDCNLIRVIIFKKHIPEDILILLFIDVVLLNLFNK